MRASFAELALVFFGALLQMSVAQTTADDYRAAMARIREASEKDWRVMIGLVNVRLPDLPPSDEDSLRPPGISKEEGSFGWRDSAGNTYARSAWGTWNNYDESRANPYSDIPDPLRMEDGRKVTVPAMWWNERRPQIAADFSREVFGRVPDRTPPVRWEAEEISDSTIGTIPVITKRLRGHVVHSVDTSIEVNIALTLTVPKNHHGRVPVVLEFGFVFPPGFHLPKPEGPSWQEMVLNEGWGCATYIPTTVQADNGAGLTQGIIGLVNRGNPRAPGDWGALRAWAWGVSRILDYFASDDVVDTSRVAIEGLSRYGKAVLVTMAFEQRCAIALIGSSGKGGATLFRRNFGESMGNICSSGEYHWFAGNLLKCVLHPDALPVDSHELFALCAPRPVFVSCGSPNVEGTWVDDRGQFIAAQAAGPVYRLLGRKGLDVVAMPPVGTAITDGDIAFRQHNGGHTIGENWRYFIEFAERYFRREGQ
jgi:hypothetical protein